MNKIIDNYILQLKDNLTNLSDSDIQDVVQFYQEFLLDGNFHSEADMITELGTPKQLARKIMADYSVSIPEKEEELHEASSKSNLKTIWVILLGVLAAPVGIPLAIAAVVVMVAALLALTAIFIALAIVITSLFVSGIFIFVRSFGLLFGGYWASGFFYIGGGLVLTCISLMLFPIIMKFIRFLTAECTAFFQHIGRRILKHRYYKTNA